MFYRLISQLENLALRSSLSDEFLEPDIQKVLEEIFSHSHRINPELFPELQRIFLMITSISKSSNFGYFFYEKLQENSFNFCEEILRTALLTEKYYNLHDKVLKSYVRTYLLNRGANNQQIEHFDKIIPEGHGSHFLPVLDRLINTNHSPNMVNFLQPEFHHVLFTILNNDQFPSTQKKLSCIAGYLKIHQLVPAITLKCLGLLNKPELHPEKILVLLHFLYVLPYLQNLPHSENIRQIIFDLASHVRKIEMIEKYQAVKSYLMGYLLGQRMFIVE